MINLSAVPVWVIPGIVIFIFSAGIAVQNFRTQHVTPKDLESKIAACRQLQNKEIARLEADVVEIMSERADIWDKVRETEQRTAVIVADMQWVKLSLNDIKELVNVNKG